MTPTQQTRGADPTVLSARSVVLSLLLGSHPARMSSRELAAAGEQFEIPASTIRVAITRAVAAGDLVREDGDYSLGERLVARQRRQDEAVQAAARPWNGDWEIAVVVVSGRPGPARAALRERLAGVRLAELREGVWTRPANLSREPVTDPVLATFCGRPDEDPVALAARLWDLGDWAETGRRIVERVERTPHPAYRLAAAAHLVRHLTADPLLPGELLPADWPGADLRRAYAGYQAELAAH